MTNDRIKPLPLEGFSAAPLITALPDGRLMGLCDEQVDGRHAVSARFSRDGGSTWGERENLLAFPRETGGWVCGEALADSGGRIHLFMLNDARTGVIDAGEAERPGTGQMPKARLDIWHARCASGGGQWEEPRCIWRGYTGALNSVIRLVSGRILLPFSYLTDRTWRNRGGGLGEFTFMGPYDSTVLYSDDAGGTWSLANSLKIPVPDITYAYGAVEPVVVQLGDGRVWMLIRAQTGRFWESFSDDGASWSPPKPSNILSSDSPAGLVRLDDGRIVLIWNNCLRFPYAYGGRQVLHAAVSEDEGATWRGFREVGRDPKRHDPPPPNGDYGTAYPFPVVARDGRVIFRSGQGEGRAFVVSMDPLYLYETAQSTDFSGGLEDWSVFGTKGIELLPSKDRPDHNVLRLCKTDPGYPACAVWNFPIGGSGSLSLDILLEKACGGIGIGLTDHFSAPFDEEAEFHNLFNLRLVASKAAPGFIALTPEGWHTVSMTWDCRRRECAVYVDGKKKALRPLLRQSEGVCYLRVRSTAAAAESAGFSLRSVDARVDAPKQNNGR